MKQQTAIKENKNKKRRRRRRRRRSCRGFGADVAIRSF